MSTTKLACSACGGGPWRQWLVSSSLSSSLSSSSSLRCSRAASARGAVDGGGDREQPAGLEDRGSPAAAQTAAAWASAVRGTYGAATNAGNSPSPDAIVVVVALDHVGGGQRP
ncbi:MAG: hypothetical protein IPK74_39745 [Deltaproteobacteria bacterium]|nr:hypothetical protein [Deltaproteobacteria bacterium]